MGFLSSENSPITVIDLGSHQVRVLIGQAADDGSLHMLGYGQRQAKGVRAGQIVDPRAAEQCLADAISSAENFAGQRVRHAYVGLNNTLTRSLTLRLESDIAGGRVTASHLQDLRAAAADQAQAHLPSNMQWAQLHCIALSYALDGSPTSTAPEGLYGHTLQAEFHIIAAPWMAAQNIRQCLAMNQIEIARLVYGPYALAFGALDPALSQYGAFLIDLGADMTTISCFAHSQLQRSQVLPIGASQITQDIAQHFGFTQERAEKLKVTDGNLAAALATQDIDAAATLFSARGFEHAELNPVIEARMREILGAVQNLIKAPAFAKHEVHTLVFTGAGAQIKGLQAYAEAMFHDKRVRLAALHPLQGAPEALRHGDFATASGLLHYASKDRPLQAARTSLFARAPLSPHKIPVVRRLFGK